MLAAAGLASSCGTPTAATPPAQVRGVDHALGRAEVSGAVERVIALVDNLEFDLLLALGVTPVAIGNFAGESEEYRPWQRRRLDELGPPDPQVLTWNDGVDLEQVAAAQPDLIAGEDGLVEQVYGQLSALAPTLPVSQTGWRESLADLGVLLGREDQAATVVREYEAGLAAGRAAHRLDGLRLGLVTGGYADGLLNVFGAESSFAAVLADFGATSAVATTTTDLSPEQVDVLAGADVVVVLTFTGLGDPLDLPTAASIPAVAAGRVVRLSEDQSFAVQGRNPLRLPTAVEVAALIAAA